MTALFAVDRQTKAVFGIPAKTKAGPSLSHAVPELVRWICWLGHGSVRLRSDNENPISRVAESAKRALRQCGILVQSDTTAVDAHEAKAAEQALQVLRQQACILVKQAEQGGLGAQVPTGQVPGSVPNQVPAGSEVPAGSQVPTGSVQRCQQVDRCQVQVPAQVQVMCQVMQQMPFLGLITQFGHGRC